MVVGGAILLAQSTFPVRLESNPEPNAVVATSGGYSVFTGELTNSTAQTVLPAGTLVGTEGDRHGVKITVAIGPSTSAAILSSTNLIYGVKTIQDFGTDVRTEIHPDGSFTVKRIAGTETFSVVIQSLWV